MNNHFSISCLILGTSFVLSLPCTAQWQPDIRLTDHPAVSWPSQNNARSIASFGNLVIAVWRDDRNGLGEIYCKRSEDGGIIWEKDRRLTSNNSSSASPSVSISGSVVHLVWEENRNGNNEIYYKRSLDKGLSWGPDRRLTNDSAVSRNPSIATSGPNLHVVWLDNRDGVASNDNEVDNYEVYHKRSLDSGRNWSLRSSPWTITQGDKRLTYNIGFSHYPNVAVSGSVVHVVWSDIRDNNIEVFYKRSTDSGLHWDADRRLTNTSFPSLSPSVSVQDSAVHITWQESMNFNREIFYMRSLDAGTTWYDSVRLTNDPSISSEPVIAVHDRRVHVVWVEYRNGNAEIYYKRSRDNGINWDPDTRLTNNPASSFLPCITVSGKTVHVIWVDHRDGNHEIYYKRDPTGNTN